MAGTRQCGPSPSSTRTSRTGSVTGTTGRDVASPNAEAGSATTVPPKVTSHDRPAGADGVGSCTQTRFSCSSKNSCGRPVVATTPTAVRRDGVPAGRARNSSRAASSRIGGSPTSSAPRSSRDSQLAGSAAVAMT